MAMDLMAVADSTSVVVDDGGPAVSVAPLGDTPPVANPTLEPLVAEKVAQYFRDCIWSFYRLHNPAKVESGELGTLLSKFRGREAEFYFRARRKYLGPVDLGAEVQAFVVETLTSTSLQSFAAGDSVVTAEQTAKQLA